MSPIKINIDLAKNELKKIKLIATYIDGTLTKRRGFINKGIKLEGLQ